jgi:deazaflavin-dependent oxidoreductase (nitroreductase family)
MPLPRVLGRINRRVTNPFLWPIVVRLPRSGFGRIVNIGRRTGRVYRTPMLGFRRADTIVFALTYGPAAEWLQNVLASGECEFEMQRGTIHLVEPRVFRDPDRRSLPRMVRPVLAALDADDFLEMRVVSERRPGST